MKIGRLPLRGRHDRERRAECETSLISHMYHSIGDIRSREKVSHPRFWSLLGDRETLKERF